MKSKHWTIEGGKINPKIMRKCKKRTEVNRGCWDISEVNRGCWDISEVNRGVGIYQK